MNIGFIGAGKVGCSLGKYLSTHGAAVAGYFDQNRQAAAEAAQFTGSRSYEDMQRLARDADLIFLTVPDGLIPQVFRQLCAESGDLLAGKFLCHCSGSISSREAFAGIEETGAFGYSVHPLFAVSDRFETYKELGGAFFSLEGEPSHLDDMAAFLKGAGLTFQVIDPASKTKYHLAAVYASNLICGLIGQASQLLQECGFAPEDALKALTPLIAGNVEHALAAGPVQALTGPVERGDVTTLQKHLSVCESEDDRQLYLLLSRKLLDMAKEKHPERDYRELEVFLYKR
ncbi:MAG: DUF2520 domain-containing protein [Firmicutes bacterium]|nr:DUF2520 domain-containing protein [Bacillota bacterium]MBQ9016571.1 DUF2520 domain-containing protein [Bacillota bacterium]